MKTVYNSDEAMDFFLESREDEVRCVALDRSAVVGSFVEARAFFEGGARLVAATEVSEALALQGTTEAAKACTPNSFPKPTEVGTPTLAEGSVRFKEAKALLDEVYQWMGDIDSIPSGEWLKRYHVLTGEHMVLVKTSEGLEWMPAVEFDPVEGEKVDEVGAAGEPEPTKVGTPTDVEEAVGGGQSGGM